jgi:hypothetical protein
MPLVKLLLLLLLLLRTAFLYRRRRPHQRMGLLRSRPYLLLLRRTEFAVRRLRVAVFLRHIPILRLLCIPVLGLRISLLLVRPRLRRLHRLDLVIFAAGLTERPETLLGLLRPLIRRRGPSWAHWAN